MTHQNSPSAPHSTVERISLTYLPPAVYGFFFSQSEELQVAHLVLRALFGAVSGAVLFLGVSRSLPLTFDLQPAAAALFVAVFAVGGAFSASSRCSVLLMFPSMLGSRGRAYLMLFILSVLCRGPLSNIQRNVETAALSLSCNLDLQVHHSRMLWREAVRPAVVITQQLMDDEAEFQSEALSVSRTFQTIRDEVVLQYGYDRFRPKHGAAANNTQEQFTTQTMMQCDSVVDEGVQRCADWFRLRWVKCMEAIPVPVINHILCVSMKFHFLCDVMRVMTPWCREQIPVEGNFGQLFDQLNLSVDQLSREFSTLLSFTFITIFTQQYRRDVRFDNIYITTYFRQIDARRRRAGKLCLLPLKQPEKKKLIDPWSPAVHLDELQQVTSGVFQLLSVSLLSAVLLTVDFSLFHVLDIVSRHTFTQFNLTSSHQVDIRVGGASMMARLLRKTVSAFNSSSSLDIHTDNQVCVSPPSSLSAGVYVSCVCGVLLVALFSCLQVYTNRLRRVIAAFYHPQREKKRVLFLYNLQLQRRISSADRKRIIMRGRRSRAVLECLSRCGRRLCRLQQQEVWNFKEMSPVRPGQEVPAASHR
ncbi:E3 ubiquitin-protein ligase DCST1 isoform X5 [Acanthopagrus latus]|uniref:E3 ubiquitin-protein ligase DCST1 isoform X5 n=1 Tax=Acanthopagrus latus TaxID=8177 RepID=UPI00187CA749|nr:E3 ubiquitin-protein ligase DCST1 isoform X5 [Acanthopagrus latus]